MNDLINRKAVIDALVRRTGFEWENLKIIQPMLCVIENMPSAQPKGGRWREMEHDLGYECSECGWESDASYYYCPNCGARMETQ